MNLFEIEHEEKPREKLPTLRQWLKIRGKKPLPKLIPVFLVWTPSKFPNFTLESEFFRYSIEKGTIAFEALQAAIPELVTSDRTIALSIVSEEPIKVTFKQSSEKGSWASLGPTGWKFDNR